MNRREALIGISTTVAAIAVGCEFPNKNRPVIYHQVRITPSNDTVSLKQTSSEQGTVLEVSTNDPSKTDRISEKVKEACDAATIETGLDGTNKTLVTPFQDCLQRRFNLARALQASK